MPAPVAVSQFQVKSLDQPDEVRAPDKTRVEVVQVDNYTIGRLHFEPGWRWSDCVKPVARTERCQLSHVGYCVSGTLRVQLADGTEKTLRAGESYSIPPGHDAWVEGNQPFVGIEVLSADVFAKPTQESGR